MELKSGQEVVPIEGEEFERLSKEFDRNKYGLVRLQPQGWFYHSSFLKYADKYLDFKFRPSDVVIMTYPKCGTTWMREIVWTMKHNANFDNPEAEKCLEIRSPFVDCDFHEDKGTLDGEEAPDLEFISSLNLEEKETQTGIFLKIAEDCPDPRILKIHLPFSLMNPKILNICKVIYVARNPKDVCVSFHHQHRLMKDCPFTGTWDQFINHFINDEIMYSPFWTHIKEAWERRNHPNLLLCFFEEMKENQRKNISRLNRFLQTNLSEKQIDKILHYTSFSSMKERDALMGMPGSIPSFMVEEVYKKEGGFFRKGESGDWKTKMNKEQEERINEWSKKNLKEFDTEFPYHKMF